MDDAHTGHRLVLVANFAEVDLKHLRLDLGKETDGGDFVGGASLEGDVRVDHGRLDVSSSGGHLNRVLAGRQGNPAGRCAEGQINQCLCAVDIDINSRRVR